MKKYLCLCTLISILALAGCAYTYPAEEAVVSPGNQEGNKEQESLGLEPVFDYDVPISRPGILVNQTGYVPEGKKVVVFRGSRMPDSFEVVDEETGEVVFTGKVGDERYNDALKEYNGYGVFDDLEKPGSYYIQAPILGRSYSFRIEKSIYDDAFYLACKKYYFSRCGITLVEALAGDAAHTACHTQAALLDEDNRISLDVSGGWHMDENYSKSVVKGSQVMANLLLAYELHPGVFPDEMGIPESGNEIPDILDEVKYEADWMLKMQDSATGGVYSEIEVKEKHMTPYATRQEYYVEPVTLEATASFAAVMAKFSYIYQAYDTAYATECLRAADRAWRFMENSRSEKEIEQRFFAAAELYRATGYSSYRRAAESYLAEGAYNMENDYFFWGCTTYISTKQSVDMNICSDVMKALMNDAENISERARGAGYLAFGNKEQDNNDELLHQMMRLTVADHIIANHEYETIIENHIHYFMGRNGKAISYIDGAGTNNYAAIDAKLGIMNRFDLNAELIFMMSEVISWYNNVEG
jgi:endoglucanase